jgi:hypothetical protein
MAVTQAPPKAAPGDFIPLRLTLADPAPASPMPAPAVRVRPEEDVPLFPEDNSLLGFILGRPGKGGEKSAAPPPQPMSFARAARGLVNLVRTKTESPRERSMPTAEQRSPRVTLPPAYGEQRPAAPRHAEPAATERPVKMAHNSAVDQMQPLIPGLLASLDEAMDDVRRGFNKADPIAVEEAAARIAARADNYGLRILARMARCVEMAAKAGDKDALANILPDLETAVERNRIALQPKK